MARILLVRHGESEWNAVGRWQGQADPPLSDLGRRQAKAASKALGQLDLVACSDLQRAQETAEIIASELGVGPVVVDAGLRERDVAEWSGLTRGEIHEQWPGYLRDDPAFGDGSSRSEERRPPGWEPDDHVLRRALEAIDRMTSLVGEGDALIVTHGGLIYALESDLGGAWHRIPNLGGRWLETGGGGITLGDRVTLVDPHDVAVTTPDQL